MSGWGDEEDYDIDDAVIDAGSAVPVSTDGAIASDSLTAVVPGPAPSAGLPAAAVPPAPSDAPSDDPSDRIPVVSLQGHRTSVAPGSAMVPTTVADEMTMRSRKFLTKFAPPNQPALKRAMSEILHDIHTHSKNGVS